MLKSEVIPSQKIARQDSKAISRTGWQAIWNFRVLYLIIFPTFALLLVFNYAPILLGFYFSFTHYDGVHASWTGLENYRRIFQDLAMIRSYKNMAIILPFSIVVGITVPLFIAYLIYHLKHGSLRYWFRVMYTLPMVLPGIVMLLIWIYMYQPGGGLNVVLDTLGLHSLTLNSNGEPRSWLGEFDTALAAILFVGFPWVAPVNMLIFLAGLEAIEVELIDAARVDGARGWRMFWFIELPMIMGQIRLILVTSTIGVMQSFQNILVMTSGGPGYSTMVPALRMYEVAMGNNMGFGSAIGVFLFVLIMAVTLFNLRVIRRAEPEVIR
jgi:raffinose/stachyose/melibiose transport system permease protein